MNLVDVYCDKLPQQLLRYNKIAEQYPKLRPFQVDLDYVPEPDEDLLWFRPRHEETVFNDNTTRTDYTYRSNPFNTVRVTY